MPPFLRPSASAPHRTVGTRFRQRSCCRTPSLRQPANERSRRAHPFEAPSPQATERYSGRDDRFHVGEALDARRTEAGVAHVKSAAPVVDHESCRRQVEFREQSVEITCVLCECVANGRLAAVPHTDEVWRNCAASRCNYVRDDIAPQIGRGRIAVQVQATPTPLHVKTLTAVLYCAVVSRVPLAETVSLQVGRGATPKAIRTTYIRTKLSTAWETSANTTADQFLASKSKTILQRCLETSNRAVT